jgi:hypothetical protein
MPCWILLKVIDMTNPLLRAYDYQIKNAYHSSSLFANSLKIPAVPINLDRKFSMALKVLILTRIGDQYYLFDSELNRFAEICPIVVVDFMHLSRVPSIHCPEKLLKSGEVRQPCSQC